MSNKFLKGVELNEGADQGYFIPNLTGEEAPSEQTEGAIGSQYMDILTGEIYKCIAVSGDVRTWELFSGGGSAGGTNGTTFYPTVSTQGVISWTNDGNKENPTPVDLVNAVISALPVYNGEVEDV